MRRRVLLVEDEEAIHFGMREYLGPRGYLVEGAHSAAEALARLATDTYAVVVADLRLSESGGPDDLDGLEIVENVRRDHPDTRLVILTACSADLEPEARRRGADCFLQKPQPLSRLAEVVEALSGGAAARGAAAAEAPVPARKKILLGGVSGMVLFAEQALLARSYDVVAARDGREAIAKALAEAPDLVLVDMAMPLLGGAELAQRLRLMAPEHRIPILVACTRREMEMAEARHGRACCEYVAKPFTRQELLARVKSLIGE